MTSNLERLVSWNYVLQPVDVHVRKETVEDARDLCFTNGIVFVSEVGSGAIRVIGLKGKVCLKPELGPEITSRATFSAGSF